MRDEKKVVKEQLKDYAVLAEILGGIAVVVSLLLLVFETRENTNAIQAQTYQGLTAELNEARRNSASAELTDILMKSRETGFDSLTDNERYRLMASRHAIWGVYESSYYARERGILGENEWARFLTAICRNRIANDEALWEPESTGPSIARNITPVFREFVEISCTE